MQLARLRDGFVTTQLPYVAVRLGSQLGGRASRFAIEDLAETAEQPLVVVGHRTRERHTEAERLDQREGRAGEAQRVGGRALPSVRPVTAGCTIGASQIAAVKSLRGVSANVSESAGDLRSSPFELQALMSLTATLRTRPVGNTPAGTRLEVTFEGTATSPHWNGEWPVNGIDHITVGSAGTARLDVHTVVGDGDEVIAYRGIGRAGADGVREGVVFETASERLAWLNGAVAVGRGKVVGDVLTVDLYLID